MSFIVQWMVSIVFSKKSTAYQLCVSQTYMNKTTFVIVQLSPPSKHIKPRFLVERGSKLANYYFYLLTIKIS